MICCPAAPEWLRHWQSTSSYGEVYQPKEHWQALVGWWSCKISAFILLSIDLYTVCALRFVDLTDMWRIKSSLLYYCIVIIIIIIIIIINTLGSKLHFIVQCFDAVKYNKTVYTEFVYNHRKISRKHYISVYIPTI